MSLLTGRELEFLASLKTSWSRLYSTELARLLKEDDRLRDTGVEAHSFVQDFRVVRLPVFSTTAARRGIQGR